MTPLGRAVLGAAVGGTLALIAHPSSRPYFLGVIESRSGERIRREMPDFSRNLNVPRNLDDAALWLRIGLEKTVRNENLKASELETLRLLAAQGEEKDRGNAFWLQSQAVFEAKAGRRQKAAELWRRASKGAAWNDRQNPLLQRAVASLGDEKNQAWPYALLTMCRNHATVAAVERYARGRLAGANLSSAKGALVRVEVIRNGELIRKGARTMADGMVGAKLVDLAVYPPEFMTVSRPKQLYLGRGQLYRTLRAESMGGEIPTLVRTFHENEAWATIVSPEEAESNFREMAARSAILAVFPGAVLITALVGALAMAFGRGINAGPRIPIAFTVAVIALLTGLAWLSSGSWLGAGAVAVCGAFVLYRPRHERAIEVNGLGPLFQFVIGMLALCAGLSCAFWLTGQSVPAREITASLPALPDWWIDPSATGALTALFLSLIGLVAPAYALVYRVPTSRVLALAVRWFGTFLFFGAWVLLLVGTPFVITADRDLQSRLSKILLNEPVYYLTDGE
ncbi:hypothetical protein EON79_00125 [bacterium]|nr:MAG: hypothetical protein EON79_00125 [bacterium]